MGGPNYSDNASYGDGNPLDVEEKEEVVVEESTEEKSNG